MGSAGIVKAKVIGDRGASLRHGVVSPEIDLLIFDGSPEPFDEDVIAPGALAVHADGDAGFEKNVCEGRAGELAEP